MTNNIPVNFHSRRDFFLDKKKNMNIYAMSANLLNLFVNTADGEAGSLENNSTTEFWNQISFA